MVVLLYIFRDRDLGKSSDYSLSKIKQDTLSDIYPEYYILRVNEFNDIAKNTLDEWIYFLKNEEIEDRFQAKGLDEAKEALDVMKLKDEDRAIYKRREENV